MSDLNPLKQSIYFMPMMSHTWHLWKAGERRSVCGLDWEVASMSWNATSDPPARGICDKCRQA